MTNRHGLSLHAMFGTTSSASRPWWRAVHHVAPDLVTSGPRRRPRDSGTAGCKAIICQEDQSPRFDATIRIRRVAEDSRVRDVSGGHLASEWPRLGFPPPPPPPRPGVAA